MKEQIRTIGIDDAAFNRQKSTRTFVFGVIMRGHSLVEGILRTSVEVDGLDATDCVGKMIKSSKFCKQLKAVFFASSTIAAFNVIDLEELFNKINIPIMVVLDRLPNKKLVKDALKHTREGEKRYEILAKSPPIQQISFTNNIGRICEVNVQYLGLKNLQEAKKFLERTASVSAVPESLRLADMIGQTFKSFRI